jgi:ankyrin repeat protein
VESQIFEAVQGGNLAEVQQIVDADPQAINALNEEGLSPLIVAAYWGQTEILSYLRQQSGELDFWEAVVLGEKARVKTFIDQDPGLVTAYSPDGFTALHLAVFFGQPETARLLLEAGANVLARTTNALDNHPLHAAVAGSNAATRLASAELLLKAGAAVNERQSGGFTALMAAAQNADTDLLRLLLAHGADPSITDEQGRSAADIARAAGHTEIEDQLGLRVAQPAPDEVR